MIRRTIRHYETDIPRCSGRVTILGLGFLLSFLIVLLNGSAIAQHCDPAILQHALEDTDIGYHRYSNRCEGFYRAAVASHPFAVVGLTIGPLRYDIDPGEVLEVSPPYHKGAVRIRAMAIPNKTYYRMDAALAAGQKLSWPIKDVIHKRPYELTCDKIGLLAMKREKGEEIYLPVQADPRKAPGDADNRFHLILSPAFDFAVFKHRTIQTLANGKKIAGAWEDPRTQMRIYRMGTPLTILLPPDSTGALEVEVAGRIKNQESWITKLIRLNLGHR